MTHLHCKMAPATLLFLIFAFASESLCASLPNNEDVIKSVPTDSILEPPPERAFSQYNPNSETIFSDSVYNVENFETPLIPQSGEIVDITIDSDSSDDLTNQGDEEIIISSNSPRMENLYDGLITEPKEYIDTSDIQPRKTFVNIFPLKLVTNETTDGIKAQSEKSIVSDRKSNLNSDTLTYHSQSVSVNGNEPAKRENKEHTKSFNINLEELSQPPTTLSEALMSSFSKPSSTYSPLHLQPPTINNSSIFKPENLRKLLVKVSEPNENVDLYQDPNLTVVPTLINSKGISNYEQIKQKYGFTPSYQNKDLEGTFTNTNQQSGVVREILQRENHHKHIPQRQDPQLPQQSGGSVNFKPSSVNTQQENAFTESSTPEDEMEAETVSTPRIFHIAGNNFENNSKNQYSTNSDQPTSVAGVFSSRFGNNAGKESSPTFNSRRTLLNNNSDLKLTSPVPPDNSDSETPSRQRKGVDAFYPPTLQLQRNIHPQDLTMNNPQLILLQCGSLCQKCNATGMVTDGVCKCYSDNGGEVVCLASKQEIIAKAEEEKSLQPMSAAEPSDRLDEGERGQRCSDTVSYPTESLRSVLAKGLHELSPEERLAEFRKRVELLRSRSALARSKYNSSDNPNHDTESPVNTNLPLSPFNEGIPTEDSEDPESIELEAIKNEEQVSAITGNTSNMEITLPYFPEETETSSFKRSVKNGAVNPVITFLMPELEGQLANVESFGIMGDFSNTGSQRVQRSAEYYELNSPEETSSEEEKHRPYHKPHLLKHSNVTHNNSSNPIFHKHMMNFNHKNISSPMFYESMIVNSPNKGDMTNLGRSISNMTHGNVNALTDILHYSGARKEVGDIVAKIMARYQNDNINHGHILLN